MDKIRDHLALYLVLIIVVQVALEAAQAMTPVPTDLLGPDGKVWLEGVLRAALEGLSAGVIAAVSVVAAAAGIEIRSGRSAKKPEEGVEQ